MLPALILAACATLTYGQELKHPALTDNLDYLLKGNMDNLPPTKSSWKKWDSSTLPEDCKTYAEEQNLTATDMETYNVTYTDCGDPYIMCRHKRSPIKLSTFIEMFGRMPVHMRDWVKHAIALPNPDGASAFNAGGTIVFFDTAAGNLDIFLHETGHSLDGQGAMAGYPNGSYSSGKRFMKAYRQDTHVPDNYAQTNIVEDFAQNTVVAVYDTVVPGGFKGVQPRWRTLHHQYSTLKADAGCEIIPGGTCNRRLAPSPPVPAKNKGSSKLSASKSEGKKSWDSFFANKYDLVEPNRDLDTRTICKFHEK